MFMLLLKKAHHSPKDEVKRVFKITLEDDGCWSRTQREHQATSMVNIWQCAALLQRKGPYLLLMKEMKKPLEHCG
ncbi:hypothetical protein PAXRUDRAFT_767315 [Paxillus rubicundulus Ve08.2h10]|uniref:Uncharacterized protein n=1 Tax=Paxillus rubicundulus Ve08.2h10 TaxID=930991 RepID=A0A0D0DFW5_9AGAM|nr:hypothetical protein PAXRUDRAFT_767315 [Paxillus rubicundulus Ve08.2h10]